MKHIARDGHGKSGQFKPTIEAPHLVRLSLDALAGLSVSLNASAFETPAAMKAYSQPERRIEDIRKYMPGLPGTKRKV